MSNRHQTRMLRNTLSQASVPKVERTAAGLRAGGLLLRGCVTATYLVDSPERVGNDYWLGETPVACYCDVLCYSGIPGQRWIYLRKVLVTQDRGGLHNGRIWKPKATTFDLTKIDYVADGGSNPANWDGDHVLVGFLEDSLNLPVILRGIPHPAQDVGGTEADKGHRLRLKVADGDPDFLKHHGSFFGLDDNGDFIVDLTTAYSAALAPDGTEPTPPGDGSVGNYRVRLPVASKLIVEIDGGASFELDLADGNAKLKLGDGAKHVAIVEALQAFYASAVKGAFDNHTHPTGVGPSGGPVPKAVMDPWDSTINSTKVAIPNG